MDNLLILSQEKGILESLKIILKDEFLILAAREREDALNILREEAVDIMVLDIPVSGVDVSTLAEEIRKVREEVMIIILSASKQNTLAEIEEEGVCEVVSKPFQSRELLNIVKKAREKSRLLRELKFFRTLTKLSVFCSWKKSPLIPD